MPRLRPRVEIKRIAEDRYAVHASYGTQVFSDSVMSGAASRDWLWHQITSFWGRSFDVDYFEEIKDESQA